MFGLKRKSKFCLALGAYELRKAGCTDGFSIRIFGEYLYAIFDGLTA